VKAGLNELYSHADVQNGVPNYSPRSLAFIFGVAMSLFADKAHCIHVRTGTNARSSRPLTLLAASMRSSGIEVALNDVAQWAVPAIGHGRVRSCSALLPVKAGECRVTVRKCDIAFWRCLWLTAPISSNLDSSLLSFSGSAELLIGHGTPSKRRHFV